MKAGYEKIYKDLNEFTKVFKYKNLYFPISRIYSVLKEEWTVSRSTMNRWVNNPDKWDEIKMISGAEVLIAAPVGEKHLIITNGDLININTLTLVCDNGRSTVSFTQDGKSYTIYRANLVYKKFIDPEYDLRNKDIFYLDMNMNNADISNLMYKNKEGKKSKTKRRKQKQQPSKLARGYGKYD